jgi:hypothetical protein
MRERATLCIWHVSDDVNAMVLPVTVDFSFQKLLLNTEIIGKIGK